MVLEVNGWDSQRLLTAIAFILLRECLGYSVAFNEAGSTSGIYHRTAKRRPENGDAGELLGALLEGDTRLVRRTVYSRGRAIRRPAALHCLPVLGADGTDPVVFQPQGTCAVPLEGSRLHAYQDGGSGR